MRASRLSMITGRGSQADLAPNAVFGTIGLNSYSRFALPMPDNQYIIELLQHDGSIEPVLARCDNAIIGRAAFVAACEYLPDSKIVYRWRADVWEGGQYSSD